MESIRRVVFKSKINTLYGFTLIELLVVTGILGIFAIILIVFINPPEQIARTKDAGRKSTIKQISRGLQAYVTQIGYYPDPQANLDTLLIESGSLKTFPENPSGISASCSSTEGQGAVNIKGYCYNKSLNIDYPNGVVLYIPLESSKDNKICNGDRAWFAWSSLAGTGYYCTPNINTEPPVIITSFVSESQPPTPTPTDIPSPTPTDIPPPTLTPTATPTLTPTPTPVTCLGIGGTCKTSCKGGQTSQGQLDCVVGNVCCK